MGWSQKDHKRDAFSFCSVDVFISNDENMENMDELINAGLQFSHINRKIFSQKWL